MRSRGAAAARRPDDVSSQQPAWSFAKSGDEQLDALGTWIWDLTTDSVTCSDEIAELAGLRPGQLDGDIGSFAARFTASSRHALRAAMTAAVEGATPFKAALELECVDHQAKPVRISARPFRDSDGHTVWVVGTLSAAEVPIWSEPHDPRSAAAAYRHVSELI